MQHMQLSPDMSMMISMTETTLYGIYITYTRQMKK